MTFFVRQSIDEMQIKINQKSAYAPLRYEATRPFANQLGKRYIASSRQGEKQRLLFVSSELIHLVRKEVERHPVNDPGPTQNEAVTIQIFGEFQANGKIIFDVATLLSQNLLLTDAESIPCSELVFPAPCFYLHFGANCGLTDDGLDIEGAFIAKYKDRLIVDLVSNGFGQADYFSLPMREILIGVPIDISHGSKSILQALDDSITAVVEQRAQSLAEIAALEARLTQQYGQIIKVPSSIERLDEKRYILRKTLGLIVNTLFYLMAEPEDIADGWGRDTPIDAVDAISTAEKHGTKKTIENTLLKSGYVKVRYVGHKFVQSVSARAVEKIMGTGGKTLTTHIRRGHFRRQAYGQQLMLRKTIFVAPVVVNNDKGELVQGRIYDVQPTK